MTTATFPRTATDVDATLSAVADDHRRAVLRSLAESDEEALDLDGLVDRVAERVADGEPASGARKQRLRTVLHHTHLPKLAACGLIVHDAERNRIEAETEELSGEVLTAVDAHEGGD